MLLGCGSVEGGVTREPRPGVEPGRRLTLGPLAGDALAEDGVVVADVGDLDAQTAFYRDVVTPEVQDAAGDTVTAALEEMKSLAVSIQSSVAGSAA